MTNKSGAAPQVAISSTASNSQISKGKKRFGSTRGGGSKMRAKLPPIEAYEKELEFQAEGPGRVIVRLERLMGSDRVRLTDTKYMATLLERLEGEERQAWTKRRLARIKTERQRFRKLAIDGLTEPGPDMPDLTNHPVFRVNRILNKMAQIDSQLTPKPAEQLPPIIEVNPFESDDTGRIFCSYPSHVSLQRELHRGSASAHHSVRSSSLGAYRGSPRSTINKTESSIRASSMRPSNVKSSSRFSGDRSQKSGANPDEPLAGSAKVSPSSKFYTMRPSEAQPKPLEEMQKDYGVITEKDLLREYEPHRASLVQTIFEEDGQDLYRTANAVLQVYKYEQQAVDEFIRKNRHMQL